MRNKNWAKVKKQKEDNDNNKRKLNKAKIGSQLDSLTSDALQLVEDMDIERNHI